MTPRLARMKTPTAAQMAQKVDELVAAHKQAEDDLLRARYETQARTELTEELNREFFDSVLAEQHREAGMTFVRDVWPTHPAAGHLVGESAGTFSGRRPCGARRPFRLEADGVYFGDYWVCSPLYPAGRLPEGGIVVAFLVGDRWVQGVPAAPQVSQFGGVAGGFDALRGLGLRMNPAPLRGRPELTPAPNSSGVFVEGELINVGDQAAADWTVRSADDLLWRFVNATQNEAPWEVPAAS